VEGGLARERKGRLPEVVGAIFVGYKDKSDSRVILNRIDTYRGGRVVFFGVLLQGFCQRFAMSGSVSMKRSVSCDLPRTRDLIVWTL